MVFGLEGGWGEGKTSILNLVEATIHNDDPDMVVVRFDPWSVTDLSTLTEAFLLQLAAAIGSLPREGVAQKAAQRVLRFAEFIAPVKLLPGVEP